MTDQHPVLWRVLKNLEKFDVLAADEIMCEQEFATLGTDPGGLLLTDQRLLFVTTTLLGRKKDVRAIPLLEVVATATSSGRFPKKDNGVLRVTRRSELGEEEIEFERIPGGQDRADEIAQSIERQQRFL